ncbi:hypothetical protein [Inhella gelatinilytica]|uniref:Lipoprotein n=1 Tax=Inhella gelatinilytica TaxID=2795030 RepID=A0A931IYK9_9BURK|nr:hypothetical protein [Inhella gelatinilytica]MBH9552383.1 hypothetical protein [Inhella gelatinilytica]
MLQLRCARNALITAALALALGGCAVTPGAQTHSTEAARSQQAADEYRRAGATGAGETAQQRANVQAREASRACSGVLECVVEVLIYSWLRSPDSPSGKK